MNALIALTGRFVLAVILVLIGSMVIGGVVIAVFGNPWSFAPGLSEVFWPMVASSALLVLALVLPVRASLLSRWPRVSAVFVTCLGVNVLLMQVEAVAFLDMNALQMAAAMTNATLAAAWLSLVTGIVLGDDEGIPAEPAPAPGMRQIAVRILACAGVYLVLYLVAGMAIYPQVADFYTAQNFQAGPWIVPLAFFRGALYVVFSYWLIRSLRLSRLQCALAVAVMFPLLAGVAALVIPNGFMPSDIRFWHAIEVGSSNFVYGFVVGWLFWRGRA